MSNIYPEWIQEQLDKIASDSFRTSDERLAIRLAAVESRIIHHIGRRFDRVEARLEYLIGCFDAHES